MESLSNLKAGLLFAGFSLLFSACTPVDGNSLLTDQKDDASLHAVDKTPKSEELYLKAYNTSVSGTGVTKVEISGECYTSTYPSHNIIATSGGAQVDIVDLNPSVSPAAAVASCKNGRFNLAINSFNFASGNHTIRLMLQAYDANNQIVVNDVQGASSIVLRK
ncbi:MAG: hypothetical protein AAGB31_01255 [Bdellovibrio sp.]